MDTNRRMIYMRKNPGKYRKRYSVFCTILLAGCASLPGDQNETQPTNSTEATKAPDTTDATQPANTTPTADTTIPTNDNDSEDPYSPVSDIADMHSICLPCSFMSL